MRNRARNNSPPLVAPIRCAIYVRKSTDEGLDQDFNSLDAQRESAEAFIASQRAEGWIASPDRYDDGGFSGGSLERPALQRLLRDIEAGKIQCVVVYKIDRLSRSLLDFTRLVDVFDRHGVSFVSVTQQFSATTSMGRLTLNILLSFAQFEREIIGERIRDKVAAAKRKGKYTGGPAVLGYDVDHVNHRLLVNQSEAELVRHIFQRFIDLASPLNVAKELNSQGHTTKSWTLAAGEFRRGVPWNKSHVYRLLRNRLYIGEVTHKGKSYPGEHEAIVPKDLWEKAHAILAENYHARGNRTRSETPALLKGILRCGHCDKSMGITWSRKNGRQYRYYLCVSASKNGYATCPVRSIAAGTVERDVVDQLRSMLQSPEIIANTFRQAAALAPADSVCFTENDLRIALEQLDPLWESLFPAEQERIVRSLVERVVLYEDHLEVRLKRTGLMSLTAELTDSLDEAATREETGRGHSAA